MTNLVLLETINDIIRMTRISDKVTTSVVEFDTSDSNKTDIVSAIEDYRVNDVDDIDFILNLYKDSNGESEQFEVVESGEWGQEHKYQFRDVIIKYKNKLYCVGESRCGSYHSDWDYGEPTIYEVVASQITKTVYKHKAA